MATFSSPTLADPAGTTYVTLIQASPDLGFVGQVLTGAPADLAALVAAGKAKAATSEEVGGDTIPAPRPELPPAADIPNSARLTLLQDVQGLGVRGQLVLASSATATALLASGRARPSTPAEQTLPLSTTMNLLPA